MKFITRQNMRAMNAAKYRIVTSLARPRRQPEKGKGNYRVFFNLIRSGKMNDCHICTNRAEVPGNCHIRCLKPDMAMTGDEHGIIKGWFNYPLLFDQVWATKKCSNFESSAVSNPVSDAVSV